VRGIGDALTAALQQNIGCLDNAIHYFHGSKVSRIPKPVDGAIDNNYDPRSDISRDGREPINWTGNKPRMRDQIRAYFRDRNEDSTELSAQHRDLV
jgi:hypothetical protein